MRNLHKMTLHNRTDDSDSTFTANGKYSVSGKLNGLSLYSCWVCGTEGCLS